MSQISLNYVQLFGSYIVFNYLTHILTGFLFLLQFTDIRYYVIYAEKDKFREISKNIEENVYFGAYKNNNGRNTATGYFVGRHCIGYFDTMDKYEDSDRIQIICTVPFFKNITKEKNVDAFAIVEKLQQKPMQPVSKIRVFNRTGTYRRFYYDCLTLNIGAIYPIGKQSEVIDSISEIYDRQKRASVFIHGITCAGKSSIGYLLAKKYNGRFCHSFNPTDPGDQFASLINCINSEYSDEDVPNIIVLEEADIIIKAIHKNTIALNREVPTSVHNKSTWATFLDDMIFYKNVILILTSNDSKDDIDALDKSYLRKGRIDASYVMNEPLPIYENT